MEIYVNKSGGLDPRHYRATGIDAAGAVQFADAILGADGMPQIGANGKPLRQVYQLAGPRLLRSEHPLNEALEAMRPHGPRAILRVLGNGVPSQRLDALTDAEAAALVAKWQEHAEAVRAAEMVPVK